MPTQADYSEVAICNLALADIGHGAQITALDEASQAARACRLRFPYTRDAVLRSFDWNFAARRARLPQNAIPPAFDDLGAFDLPADCLLVRAVHNPGITRWEVEGRQILTNSAGPLRVTYTALITDPRQFDSLFIDAFATRLAADLAMQLSENVSRAQNLMQLFQAKLQAARLRDSQEGEADHATRSSWLDARFDRGFVCSSEG